MAVWIIEWLMFLVLRVLPCYSSCCLEIATLKKWNYFQTFHWNFLFLAFDSYTDGELLFISPHFPNTLMIKTKKVRFLFCNPPQCFSCLFGFSFPRDTPVHRRWLVNEISVQVRKSLCSIINKYHTFT